MTWLTLTLQGILMIKVQPLTLVSSLDQTLYLSSLKSMTISQSSVETKYCAIENVIVELRIFCGQLRDFGIQISFLSEISFHAWSRGQMWSHHQTHSIEQKNRKHIYDRVIIFTMVQPQYLIWILFLIYSQFT